MLATIDWIVIVAFLMLFIGVALSFSKKSGKDLTSFFLGGRNLPWYLAGLSMVATTFAADTPLAVAGIIGKDGISGNWIWWNFLAGGMLTTFFFANLWRRADVLTEIELIELRYSGKPAAFLRGFKAVYLGLILNAFVIGWVNIALLKLLDGFFGIQWEVGIFYCAGAMLLTAAYSAMSGLKGIVMADAIQFVIAMTGCVIMAVIVVYSPEIGGMKGLIAKTDPATLRFLPEIGTDNALTGYALGFGSFFAYFGMVWWTSWYPGAEPGGGGYVAQRMMSTRSEKDAVYATLFFQIAHYCIRPWPWIIVGLCALIIYPELDNKEMGFVLVMKDYLPPGLKGLLLVAFLAAYMSTMSTQLNWGSSYLVNDVFKRFIAPNSSDKRLIMVSRITTILLMFFALSLTLVFDNIKDVWSFVIECGAGLGLVLILRWYWWRINAWSEITATATPFIIYGVLRSIYWSRLAPIAAQYEDGKVPAEILKSFEKANAMIVFPNSFFLIVGITTLAWLIITYVTKPTDTEHLQRFYKRIRPDGNWGPIAEMSNSGKEKTKIPYLLICWVSALAMTYAILIGSGKLLFMEYTEAGICAVVAVVGFLILSFALGKTKILSD